MSSKILLLLSCAALTLAACAPMPMHHVQMAPDVYHDANVNALHHGEAVIATPEVNVDLYAQPELTMHVNGGNVQHSASVSMGGITAYAAAAAINNAAAAAIHDAANAAAYHNAAHAAAYHNAAHAASYHDTDAAYHDADAAYHEAVAYHDNAHVNAVYHDNAHVNAVYHDNAHVNAVYHDNAHVNAVYHDNASINAFDPDAPSAHVVVHQQASWHGPNMYSPHEFDAFMQSLRASDFDSDRLKVVQRAAKAVAFYSDQVASVVASFDFESDRVDAAVMLYPRTLDLKNWHLVKRSFDFESSFDEVEEKTKHLRPLG